MSESIFGTTPSDDSWPGKWKQDIKHLESLVDHHKIGEALQYIFASFFPMISSFVEGYRMDRQAHIMEVLGKVQTLRNKIQACFNQFSAFSKGSGQDPLSSAQQIKIVQEALNDYKQLYSLLNNNGPGHTRYFTSDFIKGFLGHFFNKETPNATIFQNSTLKEANEKMGEVASAWKNAWESAGKVPNPDPNGGTLGIINNQFNDAKTTSESATVQAKLNYWSKQDSTSEAVTHMGFSALSGVEKTANNNIGK